MSEDDCAESICTAMRDFGKAILLEKDHLKTFCDITNTHDDSHNDIHGFCIHFLPWWYFFQELIVSLLVIFGNSHLEGAK